MRTKSFIAILLALSFLTACAAPTTPAAYPPPTTTGAYPPPTTPPLEATSVGAYPPPTVPPSGALPTPTVTPVTLTPAEKAAEQALSQKYNIPLDQITIVSKESVAWPNGCLGVVIPGVLCTDIVTDGYRVIMEANGQQYEFRTNLDGSTVIDAIQQQATLGFVVQTIAQNIQVVNPNIPLGPTYNPAFNGFLPRGGAVGNTAYVLDLIANKAIAISSSGSGDLPFIQNPNIGLAVWKGSATSQPKLAWGTSLVSPAMTSTLQIANLDGSGIETLLTETVTNTAPYQLTAEAWSADGQSLYFSKEPVGIGGYIPYAGASNLYKIDVTTKQVTEIIPQTASTGPQICLDAISNDYRFLADHCAPGWITIRDLQSGTTSALTPPANLTGWKLLGSARFSPTADRVAYALAKGDPNNEQSWVVVGSSGGGEATLVLTGQPGSYYTVQGWLDDQTLLVQSTSVGNPSVGSELFTVKVDGSSSSKVADGALLTIIDNR